MGNELVRATGARVIFSAAVQIPDVVDLYIPLKEQTLRAIVQWRHGDEVGHDEVRMIEHENRRAHVRVNMAVELDEAGFRERLRPGLPGREMAEIECRGARERVFAVVA